MRSTLPVWWARCRVLNPFLRSSNVSNYRALTWFDRAWIKFLIEHNQSWYTYICIYIIYIDTYTHIYTYTYIYTYISNAYIYVYIYNHSCIKIIYIYIIKGYLVRKLPSYGRWSWLAFTPSCQKHHHVNHPSSSWDMKHAQQFGRVWIHGWKHSRAQNPVFLQSWWLLGLPN